MLAATHRAQAAEDALRATLDASGVIGTWF